MSTTSRFVVLERVALPGRRTLFRAGAALMLAATLLAQAPPLRAQTAAPKIAADLQSVLAAPTTPKLNWTKDINVVRHVKALVVSDSQPNPVNPNDAGLLGEP